MAEKRIDQLDDAGAITPGTDEIPISQSNVAKRVTVNELGAAISVATPLAIKKAGVTTGTRRAINLVEGSGVTITTTDDSGNDEVDVTIGVSGGGGPNVAERARVYRAAAQTLTTATATAIAFDTEVYDPENVHDNATNPSRLTCKTAGTYVVSGGVRFVANSTGGRQIEIVKNGVTQAYSSHQAGTGTFHDRMNVTTQVELAVGDYVELFVYQNSGGNLDASGGVDLHLAWVRVNTSWPSFVSQTKWGTD